MQSATAKTESYKALELLAQAGPAGEEA